MKNHENSIRGYHRSSKAWYARQNKNIEVMFGMYGKEGGTSGEIRMRWNILDNRLVPQLQSYNDSWNALSLFRDLIYRMGEIDNENIQEEDFCKLLDSCGFKDLTQYENPNKKEEPKDEIITINISKEKAINLGLI